MTKMWPNWRRAGSEREPVGRAGEVAGVSDGMQRPPAFGCITSQPPPTQKDIEFVAFLCGVNVEQARELINSGAVKRWQTH